jgi:hypothetical protein
MARLSVGLDMSGHFLGPASAGKGFPPGLKQFRFRGDDVPAPAPAPAGAPIPVPQPAPGLEPELASESVPAPTGGVSARMRQGVTRP